MTADAATPPDIELGGDLGALAAAAHHARVAAFTERQRQCIDQDRFARAGLAGQRGKSGGKSSSSEETMTKSRMARISAFGNHRKS